MNRAENDRQDAVERLLQAGSKEVWIAMMTAELGKKKDIQEVLNRHAVGTQSAAETPLTLPAMVMCAAQRGLIDTAVTWIGAGGDVNATGADPGGNKVTMLMLASNGGHLQLVDTLIGFGRASIDFKTARDKPSAIVLATARGHKAIVQRLCDAGSEDLFHAMVRAEQHDRVPIINVLSTHIKKVQASRWSGEQLNSMAVAAAEGLEATVLAWIEGGGSVDATYRCENGVKDVTLLHFACGDNQPSIVDLLIKHGADTNLQDSGGDSPLMTSAFQGHASIVSRL